MSKQLVENLQEPDLADEQVMDLSEVDGIDRYYYVTGGSREFEASYNEDYGIDDGSKIPFIHNRLELAKLLSPLYIIEDYLQSYALYDRLLEEIGNIIKGCFVIRACREYPVAFKFYRSDRETHTVQLRHFLLNLIAWKPFVEINSSHILDEEFIMDPDKDIIDLDNFINKHLIIPLRDHHVKSTVVNFSISEVCYNFRKISEDYAEIMNLNFGFDTFLDMYHDNETINSIMNTTYDDLSQPSEIEERIDGLQHKLIDTLKADPYNPIGVILRANTGIKHKQLTEFVISEGLKPSLEGKTIPIQIETSTVRGGLTKPSHMFIDSSGTRKSQVNTKHVMGKAGYFGKSLTLLVRTLRMSSTVADCGSTHLVPYVVKTKKHLRKLDGKYYKIHLDDLDYEVINANKDKHLIGKTIYCRSAVTCCLDDEVCPRCIGTTANINMDIADGYAAFQTEESTKKVNQDILSTKHLLTTNSESIFFSEGFEDFFLLRQGEIHPLVNNNPVYGDDINRYGIYINPSDIRKKSELDEDSLFNTVLDSGRIYIRDLAGKKKDFMICTINKDGEPEEREIFISDDASSIMKRNGNVIPFREIDDETKLFEVVIGNNELTKPLYDIMALVDTMKKVGNETLESISQKLLDLLIDAGIDATAASSEMIINRMIRKVDNIYERPDFSRPEMPEYQIFASRRALERNRSPFAGLAYQNIKAQLLSNDLYTIRNYPSYLDPLFQTTVDMTPLKELDDAYIEKKKQEFKEKQEYYRKGTMYDPDVLNNLRQILNLKK